MMNQMDQTVKELKLHARDGDKILWFAEGVEKPKTLWAGLGNRSGLHSFAGKLLREKWEKSGERFVKRLMGLEGGTIVIQEFRNLTRDRGRWVLVKRFTVRCKSNLNLVP